MNSIIKRDPLFHSLWNFPRWMDDFDDLGHQRGLKIRETEKNIIAEAVVAGIPSKDVDVHIEDGVLTIKAQTSSEEEKENSYKSSSYSYYYTAALSNGMWDKAEAEIKNGVVKVTIPKTEASKPRKIEIKTAEK